MRITDLAEQQHNVVSRRQVRELGVQRRELLRLVGRGDWEFVTDRVLRRAGAAPTWEERLMVAVLDAGPGAALSHRAAAAVWRLPGFGGAPPEVIVSRPHRDGAVGHRPRLVLPHHVTVVGGLPVTTLPRTLFDLAGSREFGGARMTRLVSTVIGRSPQMAVSLHRMLDELARKGRPGIRVMRSVLAEHPVGVVPPTGLERRFEQLLRNAGEAPLRRQIDVGGHSWIGRVDYVDDTCALIVEIDSMTFHSSPADQARDRVRDTELLAAGYRQVLRIPEEWVWHEPWRVAPAVRSARQHLLGIAA